MTWTTENLRESITYWAPSGTNNFGDPSFASPDNTIKAKWEDRAELFIDAEGRETRSRSVVYVDTDLLTGGYLFRGNSSVANPLSVDNAFMIKDVRKISDFEVTTHERKVML